MDDVADAELSRLVAEEDLILKATEAVAEAMERRSVSRSDLAALLNVTPGEITQRMSGTRNLTLRSLAAMLHVLGATGDLVLKFPEEVTVPRNRADNPWRFQYPIILPSAPAVRAETPKISAGGEWRNLERYDSFAKAS